MEQKNALSKLVGYAQGQGASAVDIVALDSRATTVRVRHGAVEQVQRAHQRGLGCRVFYGESSAVASTSDFSDEALSGLVDEACARAKVTAAVACSGLADPNAYGEASSDVDIWDLDGRTPSVEEATALAVAAETAALEHDSRVNKSEGAEFTSVSQRVTLANSHGLLREYQATHFSLSCVPVAEVDGEMVRDWWGTSRRYLGDLSSPESVGKKAAERTLRRIGAVQPSTGQYPVIFSPETGGRIMGALSSALNGYSLMKGASFLMDSIGEKVASEHVTLVDDGLLARGLGSRPFDGEGLPSRRNVLIEKGTVRSYVLDSYSGRKLNLPSTHNASRSFQGAPTAGPTNLCLLPGSYEPGELVGSVKDGLYVIELFGFGVNGTTGDYSQGATGIWIRDGKMAEAVHEFTIAGNLKEMLQSISMVANDPHLESSVRCPTFRIDNVMVAGA